MHLIKIGNSQGIRIPKLIIDQAQLKNCELELKLVEKGLLISPIKVKKQRDGWQESIQAMLLQHGEEHIDQEWIDATLSTDTEIEW